MWKTVNEKSNTASRETSRDGKRASQMNGKSRQKEWNMSVAWSVCVMCHGLLCLWSRVKWVNTLKSEWTSMGHVFAFPDTCQSEIYCFHNHLSAKNNTILNINCQISNKDCSLSPHRCPHRCAYEYFVPPVKCKHTILSRYVCFGLMCACVSVFLLPFVSFFVGFYFDDLACSRYSACIWCICLIIRITSKSQWTDWTAPARREKNYQWESHHRSRALELRINTHRELCEQLYYKLWTQYILFT